MIHTCSLFQIQTPRLRITYIYAFSSCMMATEIPLRILSFLCVLEKRPKEWGSGWMDGWMNAGKCIDGIGWVGKKKKFEKPRWGDAKKAVYSHVPLWTALLAVPVASPPFRQAFEWNSRGLSCMNWLGGGPLIDRCFPCISASAIWLPHSFSSTLPSSFPLFIFLSQLPNCLSLPPSPPSSSVSPSGSARPPSSRGVKQTLRTVFEILCCSFFCRVSGHVMCSSGKTTVPLDLITIKVLSCSVIWCGQLTV